MHSPACRLKQLHDECWSNMITWSHHRNITSLKAMADLAATAGIALQELLPGTGLSARALASPATRVAAHQEMAFVRNLLQRSVHPEALGLLAGAKYHLPVFGHLGTALLCSENGREALRIAMRFPTLTHAFSDLRVIETRHETHLYFDDRNLPPELARFFVERDISALMTVTRDLYGIAAPAAGIDLKYPAPQLHGEHVEDLGSTPVFNAMHNRVSFRNTALLLPIPCANALTRASAIAACHREVQALQRTRHVSEQVLELLIADFRDKSMPAVADKLCLTTRTLRRRLAQEGTTFSGIRRKAFVQIATCQLQSPRLSVTQISTALGYAEPSGLIHALKRATGLASKALRRHVAQQQASLRLP